MTHKKQRCRTIRYTHKKKLTKIDDGFLWGSAIQTLQMKIEFLSLYVVFADEAEAWTKEEKKTKEI